MKKIIILLTVLSLMASVMACQKEPQPETPSKGPTRLAIMVESDIVATGSSFMVAGSNFKPEEFVFAEFEYRFSDGWAECLAHDDADEQGSVHIRIEVPENIVPDDYEVKIYAASSLHVKDRRLLTTLPIHITARDVKE